MRPRPEKKWQRISSSILGRTVKKNQFMFLSQPVFGWAREGAFVTKASSRLYFLLLVQQLEVRPDVLILGFVVPQVHNEFRVFQ